MAAVVQVRIAGTDIEGRPQSEVRIREREADANAFAGYCLALFHKRPIESEAEWGHATLEIADRGHERLARPVLAAVSELWSSQGPPLATLVAPTIGAREEAGDVCLTIRGILALSGLNPPVVVAQSIRSFAPVWATDKWWTLLVASDAPASESPSAFAHVQRFLASHPRGFSELEYYAEKLLEPPSVERLQRAVFISTAVDESARAVEDGPTYVDLPRLIDLQRRTETRSAPRVWEVIRAQMHTLVASDRFKAASSPTQVEGFVGDSQAVTVELGTTSLEVLERVRDLLGDRLAEQIRQAVEQHLPAEEALMSASKTVAQQSNHVVKLRLSREPEAVINEIRALPPSAARRAELAQLLCELLKEEAPLDMFVAAKQTPTDRVAGGLTQLAPRWGGPPEALQHPVGQLDADWLVQNGETILMTARRVGAEAFAFWIPILVEAILRSADPPPRLIEALLRTNQVAMDDAAALIRHTRVATDFVRHRSLQLWTSGHRLMGLESSLPRPTTALLEDTWERVPEPMDDRPPEVSQYADPLAGLLWGFVARVRHDRATSTWAREAAARVDGNADLAAVHALLHHSATWLPFGRDLWVAGYARLLDGVSFDASHFEYIAREVRPDDIKDERCLVINGTPGGMIELAAARVIPWLRAHEWTADLAAEPAKAIAAIVDAWQSNDERLRRAVHGYAWSMVAARSAQPRPVWLENAWQAWRDRASPDEAPVQFLRSFPVYLQVQLVALGHVSLSEVEVMAKTSLPLINVFMLKNGSGYETAVLYEVPVASTWSLVTALPPSVVLPDEIVSATGEQQDVLQRVATILDELTIPFCLGVWNHTALSWKEGRHAWVASDGRVVCLNTDREPPWYEPMRAGFGGESTQRMLAVAAAAGAPDEMLDTMPRARVVRAGGRDAGFSLSSGALRWAAAVVVLLGVIGGAAFLFMRPPSPTVDTPGARESMAAAPPPTADGATDSSAPEGTTAPSTETQAAAPAEEPVPCPFTVEKACGRLRADFSGAATYCEHVLATPKAFTRFVSKPARGPRCLKKKRSPKATATVYDRRQQNESKAFRALLTELTTAACAAHAQSDCTADTCASVTQQVGQQLTSATLDLVAKRFARTLHNRLADRAVPNLKGAMAAAIQDPKKKTAQAWLSVAMPASCAWQTLKAADRRLNAAERQLARDLDRLKERLPSHQSELERISALKPGS